MQATRFAPSSLLPILRNKRDMHIKARSEDERERERERAKDAIKASKEKGCGIIVSFFYNARPPSFLVSPHSPGYLLKQVAIPSRVNTYALVFFSSSKSTVMYFR